MSTYSTTILMTIRNNKLLYFLFLKSKQRIISNDHDGFFTMKYKMQRQSVKLSFPFYPLIFIFFYLVTQDKTFFYIKIYE